MVERLLRGHFEAEPVLLAAAVGLFTVAILARLVRDAVRRRHEGTRSG